MNGTFRFPVVFMPEGRERQAPPPERRAWTKDTAGFIYFAQLGLRFSGPIKIGWARDPAQRVGELQMGTPDEIRLLSTLAGTSALEKQLHQFFAAHRIRGEWFRWSEDLWDLATGKERLEDYALCVGWPHDPNGNTRVTPIVRLD